MTRFISRVAQPFGRIRWAALVLLACGLSASDIALPQSLPQQKRRVLNEIALPSPQTKGKTSVEEALARRRSIRRFAPQALSIAEIGQLMWAAQGITDAVRGLRTAPSAGALYPLEIYLVAPDGLYHYLPQGHRLERLGAEDLRRALAVAAADQDCVGEAALDVVIAAVMERTAKKYGDRAERYVQFEVGHVAENVLLQAAALGLGGVPIGAIHEDQVKRVLGLSDSEEPLYLLSLGRPR
jgi:SagB-type dehydrogenase family enzyme